MKLAYIEIIALSWFVSRHILSRTLFTVIIYDDVVLSKVREPRLSLAGS